MKEQEHDICEAKLEEAIIDRNFWLNRCREYQEEIRRLSDDYKFMAGKLRYERDAINLTPPPAAKETKMKTAKELKAGNVIPPPVHERKWLKNPLTVLEVSDGHTDKGGQWLYVNCSFQSPYRPGPDGQSTMKIHVRPDTQIKILQEAAQ